MGDIIVIIIICEIITIVIRTESTITIDNLLIAIRGHITETMLVAEATTIEALRQVGLLRAFAALLHLFDGIVRRDKSRTSKPPCNSRAPLPLFIPDFPGRRGGDRRDLAGPSPYHRSGPPDNGHSDSGPRGGGGGGDRRGGRGGGGPEGPPGVSLLVRNIAPDITTADLQNAFGRIGVIRDVYVPRDYHSQQPRGFAFIEYATPEMARDAKNEMNRFVIKGHEIEVVFAQERRKTPGEMRGRSADAPDDDRAAPPSRSGDRGGGGGGGRGGGGSGFERYVCNCVVVSCCLSVVFR